MNLTARLPHALTPPAQPAPGTPAPQPPVSTRNHQASNQQGALKLSLADCLRMARERNFDVRLARQAVVQAETEITRARAALLPFIGAEASYTRLDEAPSFAMGPQTVPFVSTNIQKEGVVVRQALFMGGRLRAARKAAQLAHAAEAQQQRTVEKDIAYQVTRAYRIVEVAEAFQKVAAEAVKLLRAHEHDVALLVKEGENPQLDLLRVRTELADARKELNGANNAVDLAYSALKNLLAIDLDQPLSLTEPLGHPPRPAGELAALTQTALSRRPELAALKSRIAAAEQGVKAAKGEYLPSIAAEARYEYMKGDYRDLEGGAHWTVALAAQVPIWNWRETASKVSKAASQLTQARLAYQKAADAIRLQVRQAYLDVDKAEKNIEAAESALGTAREAYRQARARYRAGEGTNTEVLDARTALTRAEANYTQALSDYNVALAALERAIGS